MKKFFKIVSLILVSGYLCVSMPSCSKDSEDGPVESVTSDAEAKKFIGTWSGYGTWTFNADGTCKYYYNSNHTGHWSYAADTKTLITDIATWNWQILAVSEDSWTGTHLAGKKGTYTYTREK